MRTFGAHSLPVMLIALVGFAGARVLVDALRGAAVRGVAAPLPDVLRLAGSPDFGTAVLAITGAFTQGLIVSTVLRARGRAALAAVLRRWPALLAGCLAYAALLTAAQRVMPAPVRALPVQLDSPTYPGTITPEIVGLDGVGRAVLTNTLQALAPDPGLPLAGLLADRGGQPATRPGRAQPVQACTDLTYMRAQVSLDRVAEYVTSHCWGNFSPRDAALLAAAVLLVLATEALLRFKVVAVFAAGEVRGVGGLASPLITSARLGWLRFGAVTAHVWVLRLATVTLQALFCTLPLLMAREYVLPGGVAYFSGVAHVAHIAPLLLAAAGVVAAVVGALLSAFCTVYDTRLFVALQQA